MDNWNGIIEIMNQIQTAAKFAAQISPETLKLQETLARSAANVLPTESIIQQQYVLNDYTNILPQFNLPDSYYEVIQNLSNVLQSLNIEAMYVANVPLSEDEEIDQEDVKFVNEKIITEIYQPDNEKTINNNESPIIKILPVNDYVLKYLSENPNAFYSLNGNEFENVMAEIYSKLGYDVTLTPATRDGGKDIIIRKPEILGDFIYYVECKKYAPKRPIGLSIVRNLIGTINTDRVNGGIIATTSFLSRDAIDFIKDNKYDYQIKLHDYHTIRNLLDKVI